MKILSFLEGYADVSTQRKAYTNYLSRAVTPFAIVSFSLVKPEMLRVKCVVGKYGSQRTL